VLKKKETLVLVCWTCSSDYGNKKFLWVDFLASDHLKKKKKREREREIIFKMILGKYVVVKWTGSKIQWWTVVLLMLNLWVMLSWRQFCYLSL